jgi:hypothetical protein
MLGVNQLSGFGGTGGGPEMSIQTDTVSNTNSPAWTIDLGPPGPKQVLVMFASADNFGTDPWDWGTGSVGGEAFTYVVPGGQETSGNGSGHTGGVTVRTIETSLSGNQTLEIPIVGFTGTMNENRFLAFITRGFSATPIDYYDGTNQGSFPDGRDCTLNTAGARLVIVGTTAFLTAPGDLQGPGTEVTAGTGSTTAVGYDLSPAGGAADVYTFTGTTYNIAGASFA